VLHPGCRILTEGGCPEGFRKGFRFRPGEGGPKVSGPEEVHHLVACPEGARRRDAHPEEAVPWGVVGPLVGPLAGPEAGPLDGAVPWVDPMAVPWGEVGPLAGPEADPLDEVVPLAGPEAGPLGEAVAACYL